MKQELDRELFDKYPEFFQGLKISKSITPIAFGFECGDGWFEILDKLMANMSNYIKSLPKYKKFVVDIVQVKEKFGTLRIYISEGDDKIYGLIRDAEIESSKTCEICGAKENVGRTQGWIVTCCKNCFEEGRTNVQSWKILDNN